MTPLSEGQADLVLRVSKDMSKDPFDHLDRELKKYDRFLSDIEKAVALYEGKFPDLVTSIRELRVNRVKQSSKVILEIDPHEVDPLHDLGKQQLLKKTWLSFAKKTHPDLGGDPNLFVYGNLLYRSGDLDSLTALLESVNNGDLTDYLTFALKKVNALYEFRKATLGYRILCLHREGKTQEAEQLFEQQLRQLQLRLSTSME